MMYSKSLRKKTLPTKNTIPKKKKKKSFFKNEGKITFFLDKPRKFVITTSTIQEIH